MKKILILGCDGYIGEHLVQKLTTERLGLSGFDLKNTKESPDLDAFYLGNINDVGVLERCIIDVNPEIIIDLAANAEVTPESTISDYEVNFCSPTHIYNIVQNNPTLALNRIIFTSSQYVIGPSHSGDEKLGYAPHTVYGVSKVILEQKVLELHAAFADENIDFFIVRPTNVWGGRHPKYSGAWETLLKRSLVVVPSKKVVKSYCHISTLCCLYEKMIFVESGNLALEERIVYGTDLPMTQIDWIKMQVAGLNKCGCKAGFFRAPVWVLYSLSFIISIIAGVFGANNPLPRSRVHSMTFSYLVSLKAPEFLSYNRNAEELQPEVFADIDNRTRG